MTANLRGTDQHLCLTSLRRLEDQPVRYEAGPWPTAGQGIRAAAPLELALERPLGARGAVMLWLRLDAPIVNGPGIEGDSGDILQLPGVAKLNLWWYSGFAGINFAFDSKPEGQGATEVPGLPGPQWIHLAFSWDAAAGRFQGYLNGTPVRLPGTQFVPWSTGEAERLILHAARWALADVRVFAREITADEVLATVPSVYRGALDHTLGAQPLGPFDPADYRGDQLMHLPLASAEDLDGWRMEGPGAVEFHDGWMRMWSTMPEAPGGEGHLVHWCPRDLPADFLLEFDCRVRSEYGLNIVFFCATGRGGEDVFDPALAPRTGIFGHYTNGDLNCYHVSYFAQGANAPGRITSNLRKNDGFYLVDNGPLGIQPGSAAVHHVAILKQGGRIRVGVDGRAIIDWFDDGVQYGPVLGAGKIALRQMRWTVADYRNLTAYAVR